MKTNFKFWIAIIIFIGLFFETMNSKSDEQEEDESFDVYGYLNDFPEISIESYKYLVETDNKISIVDSLLIFEYKIKNLDSINYYIPTLGIIFSGNISDSWSFCRYTELIFMFHTINYYPVGASIQCEFDLPLRAYFNAIPFLHTLEPQKVINIKVIFSKHIYNEWGLAKFFDDETDYIFLSKIPIIHENILLSMINAFNLTQSKDLFIKNELSIEIENRYPEIIGVISFRKSNVPIDRASSEKLNHYFIHNIEIIGELKKEQINY